MANNEIGTKNLNKSNRDSAQKALAAMKIKFSAMKVITTREMVNGKEIIREKFIKE